ncbi:MAG: DUF3226 domain-containing protein [Terracidiphilus sp.]|jgi:hypothetical protein
MATQAVRPCKSDDESLLLVEGRNDCHAVFQLVRLRHGADPAFGIFDCENDDGVLDQLSSRLAQPIPRQKVLGLILDADIEGSTEADAVQRRWAQLKDRFGADYNLPAAFPETGLIIDPMPGRRATGTLPRIGVWLMPNNRAYGMFEDLLMDSLGDHEKEYTSKVVKQAKTDKVASFHDSHLSKAVIRTYMAWQEPPDIQYLGLAIQKRHFQNIETACAQFLDWLGRIFVPLTR